MPPTPTTAGEPASTGSPLPVTRLNPPPNPTEWKDSPMALLKAAGLSGAMARRFIRGNGKDAKVLNRRICGGVMMTYWFESVEANAAAQRQALKMARDKNIPPSVRAYAASLIAPLSISLLRSGQSIIDNAPDDPEYPNPSKPGGSPNTQINLTFNTPPVASPAPNANSGTPIDV